MDDMEKTIPPQRITDDFRADDVTMPGRRDRKTDGRFVAGDLIMNRYKVLAELGQGGMGVVYKCFDETAGIAVALKALPPELSHNTLEMEDIKENFQLVAKLVHQNIAISKNLEKDNANGNYYLIMECVEGEDLRRWLRRKRREGEITLDDVLPIIRQVADALDYAHKQRVMHRDIKPGNIMINPAGEIKVLDFGLAAQIHTSMTRGSMAYHGTSGTGPYMAPEQWEGRAQDAKADQYALAVMAYEMLAGHTPFESTDAAVLREAVLKSQVVPLENIPKTADAAILRALSKDPAIRFENCSDFAEALSGKKIKSARVNKKSVFPKWAAVLLLLLAAGGGAGYYFRNRQQTIEQLVSKAQAAQRNAAWNEVLSLSQQILALDADNKNARNLQILAGKAIQSQQRVHELVLKAEFARSKALWNEVLSLSQQILALDADNKNAENLRILAEKAIRKQLSVNELVLKAENARNKKNWSEVLTLSQRILALDAENETAKSLQYLAGKAISRQKMIDELVLKAEIAKNKKNWQEVLNLSQQIRVLDPENGKALELKIIADNGMAVPVEKEDVQNNEADRKQQQINELILRAEAARSKKNWDGVLSLSREILQLDAGNNIAKLMQSMASQEIARINAKKAQIQLAAEQKRERAAKFEKMLDSVRQAKAAKKWREAYELAVQALQIDPENREAQLLKNEAEQKRPAVLEIVATVNGEIVPAKVKFGKRRFDITDTKFEGFSPNTDYTASLSYKSEDGEYYADLNFTCNWRGDHKIVVKLEREKPLQFILPGNVELEMIKVKRGSFIMGSPESDPDHKDDEQQHPVTVKRDYWISKFEVTQKQWRAVMDTAPFHFTGDQLPVDYVNWLEAGEFCEKLNSVLSDELPRGYKFDLPTEVQWEYAARGGIKSRGFKFSGSNDLNEVGWYYCNSGPEEYAEDEGNYWSNVKRCKTQDVGSKKPNELGIYDMSGNVAEWCKDSKYVENYGSSRNVTGIVRAYRDGAWGTYAKSCRIAERGYANEKPNPPGDHVTPNVFLRKGYIGIRLALVTDEIENTGSSSNLKYDTIQAIPVEIAGKSYSGEELYKIALKHELEGDSAQAGRFFRLAFRKGYYDTKHKLGHLYERECEWEDAVNYYETVYRKYQDLEALLRLALVYLQGQGMVVNHEAGKQCLEEAAKRGNAKAMFNLGCCYAKFRGADFSSFKYSRRDAVYWLRKAKEAGIEQADERLRYFSK